jgi:hypothetical protein
MKKLAIAATALLLSLGVNAQQAGGADAQQSTIGGVKTSTVVAGAVAAGVLVAVVSNSSGTSLPEVIKPVPTCNPGDAAPVNGVCTGTNTIVTGTGTNTSTTTVAFTYAASVK